MTQLLEVFQDIGQALDCGVETDIIYLDFAKAFDSVCPAKLVSKLKMYGIGIPCSHGPAPSLLEDNRESRIKWNLFYLI